MTESRPSTNLSFESHASTSSSLSHSQHNSQNSSGLNSKSMQKYLQDIDGIIAKRKKEISDMRQRHGSNNSILLNSTAGSPDEKSSPNSINEKLRLRSVISNADIGKDRYANNSLSLNQSHLNNRQGNGRLVL